MGTFVLRVSTDGFISRFVFHLTAFVVV